jgi:hypothetical protein
MLALPDFRMPLAEIATLTDWVIEHSYLIPSQERAERLEAERENRAPPPTRKELEEAAKAIPEEAKPPSRAYMVSVLSGVLGMSVENANLEYDRQLAEHQKKGGG